MMIDEYLIGTASLYIARIFLNILRNQAFKAGAKDEDVKEKVDYAAEVYFRRLFGKDFGYRHELKVQLQLLVNYLMN